MSFCAAINSLDSDSGLPSTSIQYSNAFLVNEAPVMSCELRYCVYLSLNLFPTRIIILDCKSESSEDMSILTNITFR